MKQNILAIETSSVLLSVALKSGKSPVLEQSFRGFLKHNENLLPLIDRLLRKKRLKPGDIDVFLIGRGPGSFTGLRVGFATLKGLMILQKKPCYGGLSLDMIADRVQLPDGTRLAVCLDAHHEKVYAKFFKRKKNAWRPESKPLTLTLPQLVSKLGRGTAVTGDALFKYREQISKHVPEKNFLPETFWYPRASTLIRMFVPSPQPSPQRGEGKKNFPSPSGRGQGEGLTQLKTPNDFLPLYLRLTEAEEKRNKTLTALTC